MHPGFLPMTMIVVPFSPIFRRRRSREIGGSESGASIRCFCLITVALPRQNHFDQFGFGLTFLCLCGLTGHVQFRPPTFWKTQRMDCFIFCCPFAPPAKAVTVHAEMLRNNKFRLTGVGRLKT
jgi:hypothetical protein